MDLKEWNIKESIKPYFKHRSELSVQKDLLFYPDKMKMYSADISNTVEAITVPRYKSDSFKQFAEQYGLSSPHTNGKAVKIAKRNIKTTRCIHRIINISDYTKFCYKQEPTRIFNVNGG